MSAAQSATTDNVQGRTADPEWAPVFVDATGHRRRWLRVAGYVAVIACLLFAIVLVTSLLWSPITPAHSKAATKSHITTSQSVSVTRHADMGAVEGVNSDAAP